MGLMSILLVALVMVTPANAVIEENYVTYRAWSIGSSGNSSYSGNWYENIFFKDYAGYDTTVTFIDNTSYSWHNTVRNTLKQTRTTWNNTAVKRAHCVSHVGGFYGLCSVYT
jgi:hypothetical protein